MKVNNNSSKRMASLLLTLALIFTLLAGPISVSYAEGEGKGKQTNQKLSMAEDEKVNLISVLIPQYSNFLISKGFNFYGPLFLAQGLNSYLVMTSLNFQNYNVIEAEEYAEENVLSPTFKVIMTEEELSFPRTEPFAEGKDYYLKDLDGDVTVKAKNKTSALVRSEDMSYCVGASGCLKQGFCKLGDYYYYSEAEKGLARGWREFEGRLYYFSPVDGRMYRNGMFSTGEGVYWFGEDGAVKEGERLGGHVGLPIVWKMPKPEELKNKWLEGDNQRLRFRGQEIANYAASFEGLPFKWFGNDLGDDNGVYCCGTVYSAHKAFGIDIPGPNDMDMELNEGFEMVKHQYDRVKEFGGELIDNDLTKLLPGDIILHMSPLSPIEYTHVGIFMGYNGDTPYYIHATIKDGVIVERVHMANEEWGAWFSDKFMRYNTEQNKGIYPYPRHQNLSKEKEKPLVTEAENKSEEAESSEQ